MIDSIERLEMLLVEHSEKLASLRWGGYGFSSGKVELKNCFVHADQSDPYVGPYAAYKGIFLEPLSRDVWRLLLSRKLSPLGKEALPPVRAIVFYGHRGVGKSTLAREVAKRLPKYKRFEIDQYRKIYNKANDMEGEREAGIRHDDEYEEAEFKIAESGGSLWLHRQFACYRGDALFIRVDCPKAVRDARVAGRESQPGFAPTPFPYVMSSSDAERIEKRFEEVFNLVEPDLELRSDLLGADEMVEQTMALLAEHGAMP